MHADEARSYAQQPKARRRGAGGWLLLAVGVAGSGVADVVLTHRVPLSPADLALVRGGPSPNVAVGWLAGLLGSDLLVWRLFGAIGVVALACATAFASSRMVGTRRAAGFGAAVVLLHPLVRTCELDVDGCSGIWATALAVFGLGLARDCVARRWVGAAIALAAAGLHSAASAPFALVPWALLGSGADDRRQALRTLLACALGCAGASAASMLAHATAAGEIAGGAADTMRSLVALAGRDGIAEPFRWATPVAAWFLLLCGGLVRARDAQSGPAALFAGIAAVATILPGVVVTRRGVADSDLVGAVTCLAIAAGSAGVTTTCARRWAMLAGLVLLAAVGTSTVGDYAMRELPARAAVASFAGHCDQLPLDRCQTVCIVGADDPMLAVARRHAAADGAFRAVSIRRLEELGAAPLDAAVAVLRWGAPADEGLLAEAPPTLQTIVVGSISAEIELVSPPPDVVWPARRARDEPSFEFRLPSDMTPTSANLTFVAVSEHAGRPHSLLRRLDASVLRRSRDDGPPRWIWHPTWRSSVHADNELHWEDGDFGAHTSSIRWTIAVSDREADHDDAPDAHDDAPFGANVRLAPFRTLTVGPK